MTAAIVLAGGAGRRMGGVDKPGLTVGGATLLDRTLRALPPDTSPIVVVGPERPTARPVRWTREDPPGSGPLAGLAAGLVALDGPGDLVAVLAADLVGLRDDTVPRLIAALETNDGAVLRDSGGHTQWLVGVWRVGSLKDVLPADPAGRSLRSVLGALAVTELPERNGESRDIDVPADLDALPGGGR